MAELFETETSARSALPGFRLSKLEIYNWGTFDGAVYSVSPLGQTTLLVGENGSGKSTLVDALLTLLVRPQSRSYNVAAGATRNERDERTYIRGAYDRTVGQSGRPQIQYLRSASGHYTALLACFSNATTQAAFTICQVLYLTGDNSVEKVYAFSEGERGIVEDLADISSASGVARLLRDRGFQTTGSYKQYASWMQRKTNFRAKAMDIFNQTVAVKDVQRLDLFIRQHMLEAKPWKEKVERLLNHFSELSEAHRSLVRVRQQDELLRPIHESGTRYVEKLAEHTAARRRLDACELYFATRTVALIEPLAASWQSRIEFLSDEIQRLDALQDRQRDAIARLNVEIEHAGGDRLRQLPGLIAQAQQISLVKLTTRNRFESQLQTAGIELRITSPEQFHKSRKSIHEQRSKLTEQRMQHRQQGNNLQFQIGTLLGQLTDERRELEALLKRKNNLPEALISLREMLCRDLKLAPSDLPYAAELMAVAAEHSDWEASIEQVLHGFARSLLVPDDVYPRVSGYVDRTRLRDGRGQGQRLVYLKVGRAADTLGGLACQGNSLIDKLVYRRDHPLAVWVRSEIAHRFNYQACESIEEFQQARGAAMTRNRHLKSGGTKHSKDDRSPVENRRDFVLGWDNRPKRQALAESIRQGEESLTQLTKRSDAITQEVDRVTAAIEALDQALAIDDFETIDFEKHEFEASQLRLEKQRLEESNDQIQELKLNRKKLEAEVAGYKSDRDKHIADRTRLESQLKNGHGLLTNAWRTVQHMEQAGRFQEMELEFPYIEADVGLPLSLDNIGTLPQESAKRLRLEVDELADRLVPMAREVTSGMTRFLRKFPDEQTDLDADVQSLASFQALYERIAQDDLPKHEARFKKRLNEKVLHEVGLLHSALENERDEIRGKIEQLNTALRLLEWKPGSYMQLEPSDEPDREIQEFRRELSGCLSGTLDGTPEANETSFVRIEKLVAKFRDDGNERWRQKVIDVRNWFNFAAREFVSETGESRSYYDGGTGQSGGEKGKLAFLVLVAAIAYQYDLDPQARGSDRFHFVMVDEMFSRSDDQHAEYALDLFDRFGLQLLIVAPLDAKARVTEPYVGTYIHVVKDKQTHRSQLLAVTAEAIHGL